MSKKSGAKKAASKKPVKKSPGAGKRPAAKAVKLVKSKPAAKPKAVTPAPRAATKETMKPAGRKSASIRLAPGQMLTEEQIRRMSDSEYMNDAQLAYFRQQLLQQRNEVLARQTEVKDRLNHQESFADPADRATAEEEHWLDLRLRERESILLRKIDDALRRIADREYGYCEVTGEPIGIPRLLARPTATVSVDVKGQNEQIESQYRDR